MNILSIEFFLLLPPIVVIYYFIPIRIKSFFLLLINLYFIFIQDKKSLIILILLASVTFNIAKYLEQGKNKRKLLIFTIIMIISMLLCSKIISMLLSKNILITENIKDFVSIAGFSFWSLEMLGYVIDVYLKKIESEKNFFNYLIFLSFFGYFISGPIERVGNIIPQLKKNQLDLKMIEHGMQIFIFGVALKLILGQRMAMIADTIYNNYIEFAGMEIVIAVFAYSIQIYADFYGYSCMVVGIGEMFGLKLIQNFQAPYLSTSITEFWKRWHISLSSWLKDYVYIPLGGNRKGQLRKYFNLLLVFLISGIWHGIGFHYIVWGGVHAIYQIFGNLSYNWRKYIWTKLKINMHTFSHKLFQRIITFLLVSFAWIFFRAENVTTAFSIIKRMIIGFDPASSFGKSYPATSGWHYAIGKSLLNKKEFFELCKITELDKFIILIFLILILAIDICHYKKKSIRNWIDGQNWLFRWSIYLFVIIIIYLFGIYGSGYNAADFIYSNF